MKERLRGTYKERERERERDGDVDIQTFKNTCTFISLRFSFHFVVEIFVVKLCC